MYRTFFKVSAFLTAHVAFPAADEQFISPVPLGRAFFRRYCDNILLRNTRGYQYKKRLDDFVFGDFEQVFLFCLMFGFRKKDIWIVSLALEGPSRKK